MLLDNEKVEEFINNSNGWKSKDKCLKKNLEFNNFSAAIAFIVRLGILAEKVGHHPDFKLHSWNKVDISLSTHSEGGITKKDVHLAEEIEKLF